MKLLFNLNWIFLNANLQFEVGGGASSGAAARSRQGQGGHLTGPDEFGSNSRHRPDMGNLRRITTDSEQWMLRSLASTADWVGRKGQQNSAGLPTLGQVNQQSFAAWS